MASKKKGVLIIILAAAVLAALVVILLLVNGKFEKKAAVGAKHVTLEVVNSAGDTTTYDVHTDAQYLRQVMDETDGFTYSGKDSEYGIMVEIVNGEQAIYDTDNAYWSLYVNGEYGNYGADSQPVTDGDIYTWKYESADAWVQDDAA